VRADLEGTRGVTVHPHAWRHGLPVVARAAAVAPPGAGRPAAACAHSIVLMTPKGKACWHLFSCASDAPVISVSTLLHQLQLPACHHRLQHILPTAGSLRPRMPRASMGYATSAAVLQRSTPSRCLLRPWHAPDTSFCASPWPPGIYVGPWQVLQIRVHGACSYGAAHKHAAREQQHPCGAAAAGAHAAVHQCVHLPLAAKASHLHVE
jgi:hypothetical protein